MQEFPGRYESVVWTDPATGQAVRDVELTAAVIRGIPGVRLGETTVVHPLVEGRAANGQKFRAFYMGDVVGISEVPSKPDSSPDL